MEKVTELTLEPIVGKFYLVPCVISAWGAYIPVIGEAHSDKELFVDFKHLHKDIRFVPLLSRSNKRFTAEEQTIGEVMEITDTGMWDRQTNGAVIWRKMKCRRKMSDFPDTRMYSQYREMHRSYLGKSIKCGKCPHRNMPLESLPQDESGNVICNGHGLKINMREQKVVQRF